MRLIPDAIDPGPHDLQPTINPISNRSGERPGSAMIPLDLALDDQPVN
jgi:hypothetical protein